MAASSSSVGSTFSPILFSKYVKELLAKWQFLAVKESIKPLQSQTEVTAHIRQICKFYSTEIASWGLA